jgi:hypothetical protein
MQHYPITESLDLKPSLSIYHTHMVFACRHHPITSSTTQIFTALKEVITSAVSRLNFKSTSHQRLKCESIVR